MNAKPQGKLNWAKRQLKSIEFDLTVCCQLYAKDPTSDVFLRGVIERGAQYQKQLEYIASLKKS